MGADKRHSLLGSLEAICWSSRRKKKQIIVFSVCFHQTSTINTRSKMKMEGKEGGKVSLRLRALEPEFDSGSYTVARSHLSPVAPRIRFCPP